MSKNDALTSGLCGCGLDRNAGELFSALSSTALHSTRRKGIRNF